MKLSLHFSPCPNDTFIFDALVNHKIDTLDFEFNTLLEDVQTLNEQAIQNIPDICKISYGVLPLIWQNYILLNSGGALGKGAGPLLVASQFFPIEEIHHKKIAIPGENTTAHLLFSYLFPLVKNKVFVPFNLIEEMVLDVSVDAGVIIHENRFTYADRGLIKLRDLGESWDEKTGLPIPLGGIVVRRSLPLNVKMELNKLILDSIHYAYLHHATNLSDFVTTHAQEMDEIVMRKHIELYVNHFSKNVGAEGKKAVEKLMKTYQHLHPEIQQPPMNADNLFIS
ncbi:MAG: 1,4-dihydroxy-6-naphthoate synthase [Bacteroidetes bacterium]|nr:1,4-dihydroxy-6-naphthoate synthase [Bacteroidota bacterium]